MYIRIRHRIIVAGKNSQKHVVHKSLEQLNERLKAQNVRCSDARTVGEVMKLRNYCNVVCKHK